MHSLNKPDPQSKQALNNSLEHVGLKMPVASEDITGVILAGGRSRRMGKNKALLEIDGMPLIQKTYLTMLSLFKEVIIITNTPDEYSFLPCCCFPDIYPDTGSIAGLHTGLKAGTTEGIFIVPCDMPFLSTSLIRQMCDHATNYDAVVPLSFQGVEPLHAFYRKRCVEPLEVYLQQGRKHIRAFLEQVRTRYVSVFDLQYQEKKSQLFFNLNTLQEYEQIQTKQAVNS